MAKKTPVARKKSISAPTAPNDPVTAWAKSVVAGKVVAGPYIRAAAARHLKDLVEGQKRGLKWDLVAANRAINFFPDVLRLNGGQFEGKPFVLHPSQAFRVGSLFGWKRADGTRRFRRFYDEEGKGSGKSPMLAGIGIYGLVADGEARAEIYAAGAKKDQAFVLFRDAVAMRHQSPSLHKRVQPSGGPGKEYNLAHLASGSFFRPISRDMGKTGSGPRPHFALCDEVHEHADRGIIDILERGFKFRRQPLLAMATNSGTDKKTICWEEHQHAVRVVTGEIEDDNAFCFVCSLDEGDDPLEDPTCWPKANPLLDVTITREYLAGVVKQAKDIPGKRNGILRLHFCIWTDSETAWIPREKWESCEDETLKFEDFLGRKCYEALDLGAKRDLAGRVIVFEDGQTEPSIASDGQEVPAKPKFVAFAHGYTPADTITQRSRDDRAPYDVWADQGHLTATPGSMVRMDYIARDVVDDAERFDLVVLTYDAWLYRNFANDLDELGVELPVMEHPQGFNSRQNTPLRMPDSIDALEEAIYEGRLRVGYNPALRSAVASAAFETSPAGLRRFTKQRATGRIDLAVCLAMAMGAAANATPVETGSIYDKPGFFM